MPMSQVAALVKLLDLCRQHFKHAIISYHINEFL